MAVIVTKQTVENYDAWKQAFDVNEALRGQYGWRSHSILRDATNPNTVVVISQVESLEKARAFMQEPKVREVMSTSGIRGIPEVLSCETPDETRY